MIKRIPYSVDIQQWFDIELHRVWRLLQRGFISEQTAHRRMLRIRKEADRRQQVSTLHENPSFRVQARYARPGQVILDPDGNHILIKDITTVPYGGHLDPSDVPLLATPDISNAGDWFTFTLDDGSDLSPFKLMFPATEYLSIYTAPVEIQGNPRKYTVPEGAPRGLKVESARDLRLLKEAETLAAAKFRRGTPSFYAYWKRIYHRMKYRIGGGEWPGIEAARKQGTKKRRRKKNPDHLAAAMQHYREFHGSEPDNITRKQTWVPGELVEVGRGDAIDVGYEIGSPQSSKGLKNLYVHDFDRDVKIYRRAKKDEKPTKIYKNFPDASMVLGYNIGFSYKDKNGKLVEIKGSRRKKLAAPDKKTLVIIGPKGVEYLMKGGKMHISDWIRN